MGRPEKPWQQKLRVMVWYELVISAARCSNQDLDDQFVWIEGRDPFANSADQPKIFEFIQKRQQVPSGHDPRFRDMDQLLSVMELDPRFAGVTEVYNSIFWDLLQNKITKPAAVMDQINLLMERSGLERHPLGQMTSTKEIGLDIQSQFSVTHIYDKCLDKSLISMQFISQISLMWLLYMQNEPSHNSKIRVMLVEKLDRTISNFFDSWPFGAPEGMYSKVIQSLLKSKLDMSDLETYPGKLEVEGLWPILPKDQVGKIDVDFFKTLNFSKIH